MTTLSTQTGGYMDSVMVTTSDHRDEYEARRVYHLRYGPPPLQVGRYDGRLLRCLYEIRSATMGWRRL